MKRTGFTLIELLVVIALLAVLAALSAGTFFRIRAAATVTSTEQSIQQLSTGLERIWSAARDQAEKEFNTGQLPGANNKIETLINFCGGPSEKDRAKALWIYLRLKNEFPQTFQEANSDVVLQTTSNTDVIRLKAKTTFTSRVPNTAMGTADVGINQAAALLYIILTESGSRGETFSAETASARTQEIDVNGRSLTVFLDAWGKPLTFVRWLQTADMNAPPFARYSGTMAPTDAKSQDPIDVLNRLSNSKWTNANGTQARKAIGQLSDGTAITLTNTLAWHPTIISAGPNGSWNVPNPAGGAALEAFSVVGTGVAMRENNVGIVSVQLGANGTDNIFSYRLRQFGARGD